LIAVALVANGSLWQDAGSVEQQAVTETSSVFHHSRLFCVR